MAQNKNLRIKKYFPPPPVIGTLVEYIDVNKDKDLRRQVTTFFHKKSIKWTSKYPEYSHVKKYLKKLKSEDGYNVIYQLIRRFVKQYEINWYDLRDYYVTFKDFLKANLVNYLK